ncbi:MAG TPA: SGNH/GDSL hydrolase family protein [Verrucomicrobiae bacterium]
MSDLPQFQVEPLDPDKHRREDFCCESIPLTEFLRKRARKEMEAHASACFVFVEDSDPGRIVGYYTLSQTSILLLAAVALLVGCGTPSQTRVERQAGESVVCIGESPAALAHVPIRAQPLLARSTYLPGQATVQYVEGRDFVLDYKAGTLRRIRGSRIPDFRTNMLFGKEEFDHTQFPGFGNSGYFVFVDYAFVPSEPWPVQEVQTRYLQATQSKLRAGGPVKIVAFGDSITAGGDASKPELIFWQRWATDLRGKYPQAQIAAINGATGGDSTVQGLQRLKAKVLDEKPDLVLIGFGMNDHNVGSVPVPDFEQNLKKLISGIRSEAGAEVVLFSAFPPNPKWKFGTHHMADYAAATARVARDISCAYADVFDNWQALDARKKPEDLLGNNINHPNDFGHWIYFRVLQALGL